MTPERWTDFAQRVSKDLFSVTLSGGEPLLLGKKLYDLMDVFEENGVWINMISNGFLMDRAAAKRIAEHSIGWIEISIDAPQAAYHADPAFYDAGNPHVSFQPDLSAVCH